MRDTHGITSLGRRRRSKRGRERRERKQLSQRREEIPIFEGQLADSDCISGDLFGEGVNLRRSEGFRGSGETFDLNLGVGCVNWVLGLSVGCLGVVA